MKDLSSGRGERGPERPTESIERCKKSTQDQRSSYVAWMGFYNSSTGKIGWSKNDLVHAANSYAIDVGMFRITGVKENRRHDGLERTKTAVECCPAVGWWWWRRRRKRRRWEAAVVAAAAAAEAEEADDNTATIRTQLRV